MHHQVLIISAATIAVVNAGAVQPVIPDRDGFERVAVPYFDRYCLDCHSDAKAKGELNLESGLANDFSDPAASAVWGEVLDVVHSHEMPPEDEPQPPAEEAARFADWVAAELARAEVARRENQVVLRRLNRAEYANTVRDLLGLEFDPDTFPADPPAGGFDNVGSALTMSPLHMELYYDAARALVDRAITRPDVERPAAMRWRFEFEEDLEGGDRTWLQRDGQRVLLNSGNNDKEGGFVVLRTEGWDKGAGFREFRLPHEGDYAIRVRAAARVPDREEVVEGVRAIRVAHDGEEAKKKGRDYDPASVEEHLAHFREESMYDYGPPRMQVEVTRGGQPALAGEFDVDAPVGAPRVYEVRARFDTAKAGIKLMNRYAVPRVLENFWFQGRDEFPRPELLLDWIEIEGPLHAEWPPAPHRKLFAGVLREGSEPGREEAEALLARFMREAWRRPVTEAELVRKLRLYDAEIEGGADFYEAVKAPLVAAMTSPAFLFLAEPVAVGEALDAHQVAARLAYFLWSSMPDAELRALAEDGGLLGAAALREQVDRMLADPRSEAFCDHFAGQWLELRKIGANPPAPDLFPRYDRHLEVSMAEESVAFFRTVLSEDLSVMNFIRSDFVTVNERMARYYGIDGVRGDAMRKVPVGEGARRGGVVTQASVLCVTSNGTRTSPVVRGTWILKNLLGTDPGLPVANAGEIAPKVPGIDKATVRQRLEIHRELTQCARCHNKIDPLGFALENYDAAGAWRDREGFGYKGRVGDRDPEIDASATMPDGTEFAGVAGLQEQLLAKEELFLRCLAEKLFTYGLGREPGYADRATVEAAAEACREGGYTLRAMIRFLVTSEAFLTK